MLKEERTLYQSIAEYYDRMFPMSKSTLSFLDGFLPQGTVLDLACGTGTYALELASTGRIVLASDLDTEMIRVARTKTVGGNPLFRVEDMRDFPTSHLLDGIYCIGNSLVHLESESQIERFLNRVYRSLREDGVLILQIINYNRVLDLHVTKLPVIHQDDIVFHRSYEMDLDNNRITFSIRVETPQGEINQVSSLLPIRKTPLDELLRKTGFQEISYFGGFDRTPYHEHDSYHLIAVAVKQGTRD